MASKYASGKASIAMCDRCGCKYKYNELKRLMIKDTLTEIRVCNSCWEPSHPQLQLGRVKVFDPQALQRPRPDTSYYVQSGSRIIQWGFNPVGGASQFDAVLTPNYLVARTYVGSVTITTT